MRRILIGASAALILLAGGLAAATILVAPSKAAAQETEDGSKSDRAAAFIDDALDELVDEGVISADQAVAVREALVGALEERIGELRRGAVHVRPRLPHLLRFGLQTAADVIGVETDELVRLMREEQQSIAQVAEAHGVDAQTVIEALIAEASATLDEIAAERDLDPQRVEELKANLPELVERFVNHERGRRLGSLPPFRDFRAGDEAGISS